MKVKLFQTQSKNSWWWESVGVSIHMLHNALRKFWSWFLSVTNNIKQTTAFKGFSHFCPLRITLNTSEQVTAFNQYQDQHVLNPRALTALQHFRYLRVSIGVPLSLPSPRKRDKRTHSQNFWSSYYDFEGKPQEIPPPPKKRYPMSSSFKPKLV